MMKRVKRLKRAAMQVAPSSSSYPAEEARARWKHQSLMQDYQELLKETEERKKKLLLTIEKRRKLLAEVKFLRRRFKSVSENPSQETKCRLKRQPLKVPSPALRINRQQSTCTQTEPYLQDRSQLAKENVTPRTAGLLDLNQVSLPSAEEMQEFQAEWGPLEVEKFQRYSVDGGELVANDVLVCRDLGNNPTRVGKRKISWQDPVALRI